MAPVPRPPHPTKAIFNFFSAFTWAIAPTGRVVDNSPVVANVERFTKFLLLIELFGFDFIISLF
jgi:hypothetical protein